MRYLTILALLFVGCASHNYHLASNNPYSSDSNYQYQDAEPYTPLAKQDAAWFTAKAEADIRAGDYSEAQINFQRAFRRDRWLIDTNLGYQNMMLERELFDDLWREYLDLYQEYPSRGDAFWYHLRPMLHFRGDSTVRKVKEKEVSAKAKSQVAELVVAAQTSFGDGETEAALANIEAAIKLSDSFALHKLRIRYTAEGELESLLKVYTERADEDPSNGDNLALQALATARTHRSKAFSLLRDGWVLEIRGIELPRTMAELARDAGDELAGDSDDMLRRRRGWYEISAAFFDLVLRASSEDIEAVGGYNYALNKLNK